MKTQEGRDTQNSVDEKDPSPAREAVRPAGVRAPDFYSPAVTAGDWVFVSSTMAADHENGVVPEARIDADSPYTRSALGLQSRHLLGHLATTLEAAGCDIQREIVRIWQWAPAPYPSDAEYAEGPHHWPPFRSMTPYVEALGDIVVDTVRHRHRRAPAAGAGGVAPGRPDRGAAPRRSASKARSAWPTGGPTAR